MRHFGVNGIVVAGRRLRPQACSSIEGKFLKVLARPPFQKTAGTLLPTRLPPYHLASCSAQQTPLRFDTRLAHTDSKNNLLDATSHYERS